MDGLQLICISLDSGDVVQGATGDMSIRDWPLGRVVLVSVLWAVAAVLLLVGWRTFSAFRGVSESGGVVGVSAGTLDIVKLAALILVPPLVLLVAWSVQRH
jgi:hypothetical protein